MADVLFFFCANVIDIYILKIAHRRLLVVFITVIVIVVVVVVSQ